MYFSWRMDHFSAPQLSPGPKSDDWDYFSKLFTNCLLIVKAKENQQLPLLLNIIGRDGMAIYEGLPTPKTTYT